MAESESTPREYEAGPTTPVVLGILSWSDNSGYEIKRIADESARFIWAVSYGQIYPELKRLAAAGLVESHEDPSGGRRRVVHTITAAGRDWLEGWLAETPDVFEMRDDAILRLLFSGLAPQTAPNALVAKRESHLAAKRQLESMEASGKPSGMALVALRCGVRMHGSMADWCDETIAALESGELGPHITPRTSEEAA
ncbi:PadR family transcriptional regulator [Thermoleophilia bacterium SCSIO 60948]|nr:PadR family transcriptional regulator [Thermoleophilia bacterium SCSIO 60948]